MSPPPRLSVVMPVYNEAAGIRHALTTAREELEGLGFAWEILIVDNASTDGTPDLISTVAGDVRIVLLRNETNRGKGHSVRRGMLEARGELILHCDADCVASFASLPRMLECLDGADVVFGSRYAAGAALGRRQPWRRRLAGRAFAGLCRKVLSEPATRDFFCGFKLWRADAARATFSRTRLDGWVFDAESLALARALGFTLREVGIVWTDREGSRLSMPSVLFPAVRDLLQARTGVRAAKSRPTSERTVGSPR